MLDDSLKTRLARSRPMTPITLQLPQDVVESLESIAASRRLSNIQTVLKAFIGDGLRHSDANDRRYQRLVEALKARGVDPGVVDAAVQDLRAG